VLSIDKKGGPFMVRIDNDETIRAEFMISKDQFYEKYGKKYIIETNLNALNENLAHVLQR
jgi:hypothetical protein